MKTDWRISSVNGALLAAYFIPAWTIVAFKIMVSPIHGLFDRPNISVALYVSDHLQLATLSTIRFAWLLALGKLTVVAFLAVFAVLLTRPAIRKSGECDEALWLGLLIGSAFSFASMLMASLMNGPLLSMTHSARWAMAASVTSARDGMPVRVPVLHVGPGDCRKATDDYFQ